VNLKQRIIGAIVLIALAVIFLPIFLQESKGPKVKVWQIPSKPGSPQVQQNVKIPAVELAPASQQQTLQSAWSLQLGTFSNQSNAQRLLNRLRNKGYSAYQIKLNSNNKIYFKVYVGPEIKKAKLEQQATQINSSLGLKGSIVIFRAIPEQGEE
jgi:DedD protein